MRFRAFAGVGSVVCLRRLVSNLGFLIRARGHSLASFHSLSLMRRRRLRWSRDARSGVGRRPYCRSAEPFNRFLCGDFSPLVRNLNALDPLVSWAPPYSTGALFLARASRAHRAYCCPGPTSQRDMAACASVKIVTLSSRLQRRCQVQSSHDYRAFCIVGFLVGSLVGFHATPVVRAIPPSH